MTSGRLESLRTSRPDGFDTRKFWAKNKAWCKNCCEDHMFREACPFHDLRANGCFQPENGGPGDVAGRISPDKLVARKCGTWLAGAYRPTLNDRTPYDIVPSGNTSKSAPVPRSGKPWTSTYKKRSLFGTTRYQSAPPVDPPPVRHEPPFHGGKVNLPPPVFPYVPEEKVKQPRPVSFRFKTGKGGRRDPLAFTAPEIPRKPSTAPMGAGKAKAVSLPIVKRPVYAPTTNIHGTFSAPPRHMPEPYEPPAAVTRKTRPFHTWAARSKRTMPVSVPWEAGLSSVEPVAS